MTAAPGRRHLASRGLAAVVVGLRWLVVPAWIALAVVATQRLPTLEQVGTSSSFQDVIPTDLPAFEAERLSLEKFGFPLLSRLAVVIRNPEGLSGDDQATIVRKAAQIDLRALPQYPDLLGAIPVLNTAGAFPGSREVGTTAVLFLFVSPNLSATAGVDLATNFAHKELASLGAQVKGVTGPVPARVEQGRQIQDKLPLVELGTIVLVAVAMALVFRSVGAPIVALGTAGLAYVLTVRVLGWLAQRGWVSTPGELEPLIVVLLVGVVTDYVIFYLSTFRDGLRSGASSAAAARRSAATTTPIVIAAALLVASGTAVLAVARLSLFARLGPGMAVTVLVALVLAATFVPAVLALLGRLALWPGGGRRGSLEQGANEDRSGWRKKVGRAAMHRPVAALVLLLGVAGLAAAAFPARRLSLGVDLVGGLPQHTEAPQAADAARQGFVPGITAPTELVVTAPGVADQDQALAALQHELTTQRGVAAVIGPGDLPLSQGVGLLRSRDRSAARYVVLLGHDPAAAAGLADFAALRRHLP